MCFGTWSTALAVSPVTLVSGRARLFTKPLMTGSSMAAITMGTELVACSSASVVSVEAETTTSTCSRATSCASSRRRSGWPLANRDS